MMQTGQQVTRLLGNTIALWMHVCNKCCTSKNYQQRISLQSFICRILELQRSELVELSLNILGKSILMRQASCDLKTSNASYICSICSALSRASSWLTRIAWEDTNLSVNHFSHASPQPFKDPVNHSILLWLAVLFSSRKLCKHNKWTERRLISDSPTKSIVNVNVKALLWTVLQMKVNASC